MRTPEQERPDQVRSTRREVGRPDGERADAREVLGNAAVGEVLSSTEVSRAGATSAQQLDEGVARAIQERQGGGKPLDDATRGHMEQALGHDLSDVRVHNDADAHDLNQAVSATAFTAGSDVFFKRGAYDPGSSEGQELLAHELTHVVQQRSGTSGLAPGEVSAPSDASEQEAAAVGQAVTGRDGSLGPTGSSEPTVAREVEEEEEELPGVARQMEEEEEEFGPA